jgi:hypothetical protein
MYLDHEEEAIRKILIAVARDRGTVTYLGIIEECGLRINLSNKYDRHEFAEMLSNICEYEHENFRPLLSVLVVNEAGKFKGLPSYSFFRFAEKIGKHRSGDDHKFFYYEKNRCYAEWENSSSAKSSNHIA